MPNVSPEFAYGKEKKFFEKPAMERGEDIVDLHNVGAHKSKVVCYTFSFYKWKRKRHQSFFANSILGQLI